MIPYLIAFAFWLFFIWAFGRLCGVRWKELFRI